MRIRNKRVSARAQREAELIAKRQAAYKARQAEKQADIKTPDYKVMAPTTTPKKAGKKVRNRHGRIVRLHADAWQDYGIRLELETVTRAAIKRQADIANKARAGKAMPDAGWIAPWLFVPSCWQKGKQGNLIERSRLDTVAYNIWSICFKGSRPGRGTSARHTIEALKSWHKAGQALMLPRSLPHLSEVLEAFACNNVAVYDD